MTTHAMADHLKPGQYVTSTVALTDRWVKQARHATACGALARDLPPATPFEVLEVSEISHWVRLLIPSTYPARFLQLDMDELHRWFTPR